MRKNEEYLIQTAVTNFLKYKYPNVLFTASAGGMRASIGTAKKMKAMGYRAGTPDLNIFEPRGIYHGLFIEIKKEKGVLSPEQKIFLEELQQRGYKSVCCYGYDVTIRVIEDYFYNLG